MFVGITDRSKGDYAIYLGGYKSNAPKFETPEIAMEKYLELWESVGGSREEMLSKTYIDKDGVEHPWVEIRKVGEND